MSHIDDGALHAYLDGALDSYPAGEAARVREHLDACPECARRLAEERRIRGEAEAILAASAPVVQMPPLEDLRTLAERRSEATRVRGLTRLNRFGWAASVVLALGTGWMLRGAIPGMISRPSVQEPMAGPSVAAPTQPADQVDGALGASVAEKEPTRGAGAPEAGAEASAADAPPRSQDDAGVDLDAPGGVEPAETEEARGRGGAAPPEEAGVQALAVPPDPSAAQPSVVGVDSLARADEAPEEPAPARAEQALQQRRAAPSAQASEFRSRALDDVAGAPAPGPEADAAKTVDRESAEGSLVVPGLALLDVTWVEDPRAESGAFAAATGAPAVRVRQRMENGDTLEVVHLPPGTDPSALPRAPEDGRTELVARSGGGWIILRADAPRVTLEAYLERLLGA